MPISFRFATEGDLPGLLTLRLAIDADQQRKFGSQRWSTTITEKSVARGFKSSRILLASRRGRVVGAVRMGTKKPWAIDLKYFTQVSRAVYLHDVNVHPDAQRTGIGRRLLEQVKACAKEWPVDAIRLDTYDGLAGSGQFYENCGFREVGRTIYRGVPLIYFELSCNFIRPWPARWNKHDFVATPAIAHRAKDSPRRNAGAAQAADELRLEASIWLSWEWEEGEIASS